MEGGVVHNSILPLIRDACFEGSCAEGDWLSAHIHQESGTPRKHLAFSTQSRAGEKASSPSIMDPACRITNFCKPEGCSFRVTQVTGEYKWPAYGCHCRARGNSQLGGQPAKTDRFLIFCCLAMTCVWKSSESCMTLEGVSPHTLRLQTK